MLTDNPDGLIVLDGQSWDEMIATLEDQAEIIRPGDEVSVRWPADQLPSRSDMLLLIGLIDRHRMDMTTKTVTQPTPLGSRRTLNVTLTKRL